jgi:hypothetical protein
VALLVQLGFDGRLSYAAMPNLPGSHNPVSLLQNHNVSTESSWREGPV